MTEITEEKLERFRLFAVTHIAKEWLDDFAMMPEVDMRHQQYEWSELEGPMILIDEALLRIKQEILGQNLEVIRCEYPTTWWDAFKQRWFPGWAKRRWPVEMTVEELRARALYPKIPIKHHDSVVNLQQRKWQETQDV